MFRPTLHPSLLRKLSTTVLLTLFVLTLALTLAPVSAEAANDDLVVSIGELTVPEGMTVPGDAIANMGSVEIHGRVLGDVEANLGAVTITGDVGGNVEADAGSIRITSTGTVAGDVRSSLGEIVADGRIGGSIRSDLGAIRIGGEVNGDVRGSTGDIQIRGTVNGDVDLDYGRVTLEPDARVLGDIHVREGLVERGPGAEVAGRVQVDLVRSPSELRRDLHWDEVDRNLPFDFFPPRASFSFPGGGVFMPNFWYDWAWGGWAGRIFGSLVSLTGALAVGALLVLLFPKAVEGVTGTVTRDLGRAALVGFLGMLLVIPIIIVLAITILGIPLIPLFALFLVAAGVLGWTGGSIALFRRLREAISPAEAPLHPLVELLGGLGVLALVGLVPVIGGLLGLALAIVGFGAVLVSRFGTRPTTPGVPVAATTLPEPAADAETPVVPPTDEDSDGTGAGENGEDTEKREE